MVNEVWKCDKCGIELNLDTDKPALKNKIVSEPCHYCGGHFKYVNTYPSIDGTHIDNVRKAPQLLSSGMFTNQSGMGKFKTLPNEPGDIPHFNMPKIEVGGNVDTNYKIGKYNLNIFKIIIGMVVLGSIIAIGYNVIKMFF